MTETNDTNATSIRELQALNEHIDTRVRERMVRIHPYRWGALAVWVAAFTLIAGIAIHQNNALGKKGDKAHDALCVYRADLQSQLDSSRQYLADISAGRRKIVPGLSAADITNGIRRQQASVDALRDLGCKPVIVPTIPQP
jgi:hypothetical protein